MTETLAPSRPSNGERDKKTAGRRRRFAMGALLLALAGGIATNPVTTDSASAQPCTQVCQAAPQRGVRPNGVTAANWSLAVRAADMWSSRAATGRNTITWQGQNNRTTYAYEMRSGRRGWVGGRNWMYVPWQRGDEYYFAGGRHMDYGGHLQTFERTFGVPASSATGGNNNTPYREYDFYASSAAVQGGTGLASPFRPRGAWRLVRNVNTGHVYVTFNHYTTFYYLGTW
ncbi:hypothetical protein ADK57_40155 [Streptomyces sp. MMG1533]|uniref:hypothetical protein n=1 Tax=Streptomyces sp. MMG1533 TaxID=1415546 RepID=UPI0006AD8F44|nr:hypothetical protein [Streptomyces sp. MMG1533]KOU57037.1 hypothetical protein ADK57_40155 [Streptomyces sp. MMG1533]